MKLRQLLLQNAKGYFSCCGMFPFSSPVDCDCCQIGECGSIHLLLIVTVARLVSVAAFISMDVGSVTDQSNPFLGDRPGDRGESF